MMGFVKLLSLVCFFAACFAFDDDLSVSPTLQRNEETLSDEGANLQDVESLRRSTNRQSYGYSPPACPNSDTLQTIMKLLVHLSKQQETQNNAPNLRASPNIDKLKQAVALYKKYLLSSKFTKENMALYNKLLEIEKNLNKGSNKKEEEAKLTITLELPLPSHPACLNALKNIAATASNAYATLKLNDVCNSNYNADKDTETPLPYTDGKEPSLQDLLDGFNNTPPSRDDFDILNYLNNYRPKGFDPNAQNRPFISSDILPYLLNNPESKDPNTSAEDLISQLVSNKKNPYDGHDYKDILSALLNSKTKNSKQTSSETQNDLLSLIMNNKGNKGPVFDPQTSQEPGLLGKNRYLNSILHDNLAKGNGHLGPSNGHINTQHVPSLGELDPAQDLLSQLLPSQNPKSNSKVTYPNPLQDLPLNIEAVDGPNYVPPKQNLKGPSLQNLEDIEFDPNYTKTVPYDADSIGRILEKLRYATYLANKLKKNPNQNGNPFVGPNYRPPVINDDLLNLLQDESPSQAPYQDNLIPNFYNDRIPKPNNNISPNTPQYGNYFDHNNAPNTPQYGNQGLPGSGDESLPDVPGGNNVFQLITSPNQTGTLELTYLLNKPTPMVEPFYFVKYKIPYETFALNFQKLLREQSYRPRSAEKFYKDLLIPSSSEVVDSSSALRSSLGGNIIDQVLKNGTLLDAKVINDNSAQGFVEVTVKTLPSNYEVARLINDLDQEKGSLNENFRSGEERRSNDMIDYLYRSDNIIGKKDTSSASLAALDEVRNKINDIWAPNFSQQSWSDSEEHTSKPVKERREKKRK